jgi:preprotein translocase subunit SecB
MRETVADVRQLLQAAEVTQIQFHEVSARRADSELDDNLELEVLVRDDECEIGVRCRVLASAGGGQYVADVEAVFTTEHDFTIPPDVMQKFVEKVGIMIAYPYARTAITDSAGKLGLPQPVLKLLRPEDMKLERRLDLDVPGEGAQDVE